jgi:hypothetical protein
LLFEPGIIGGNAHPLGNDFLRQASPDFAKHLPLPDIASDGGSSPDLRAVVAA